jgi:hypothetical protein
MAHLLGGDNANVPAGTLLMIEAAIGRWCHCLRVSYINNLLKTAWLQVIFTVLNQRLMPAAIAVFGGWRLVVGDALLGGFLLLLRSRSRL